MEMNCNTTTNICYAVDQVKLPAGWLLSIICRRTVYSYVPVYGSRGPCSVARLTVFMPQKPHNTQAWCELSLAPDCNSDLYLFSSTEYVSLTIFPFIKIRQMPWLGIKPVTLWFTDQHSIHWATPARADYVSSASHGNLFEYRNKISLCYGKSFECHLSSHRYHQSRTRTS